MPIMPQINRSLGNNQEGSYNANRAPKKDWTTEKEHYPAGHPTTILIMARKVGSG